jgi:hypothetical protein
MHVVRASEFVRELQLLSLASGDVRFLKALDALHDNGLIASSGAWATSPSHSLALIRSGQLKLDIFERVEHARSCGASMRNAYACAAAVLSMPANSFHAAVKQAERVWKSFRAKGGETLEHVGTLEDLVGSKISFWDDAFMQILNRQVENRKYDWTNAMADLVRRSLGA